MKWIRKRYVLSAILLVLFGTLLGLQIGSYSSGDGGPQEQFKKLRQAFVTITQNYVEPVPSKKLANSGVRAMVKELDPHSSFIPAGRMEDLRDQYEGAFGGVGIQFRVVDDTARVISPLPGGPSQRAGVRAGDRIVQISDTSAVKTTARAVQDHLKGKIGTTVSFTVFRPMTGKELTFTVERSEISVSTISSAYMVDDRTGYMRIGRFAKSTHDEFADSLAVLKDAGMERLVLDLRGNRGGVMRSSIKIADEFLGTGGATIVQTKYRRSSMNQQYRAQSGGAFPNQPVTVLVDRGSASASEILTGALQDHDRALVVGQRTFGKALVQRPFQLPDGSALQLTVGRYYTPVGRLIQTPYEKGETEAYYKDKAASLRQSLYDMDTYRESIADSLRYQTDHGRTVFGGGGILPDRSIEPDTTTLEAYVRGSGLAQVFAQRWFSNHEQQLRSSWQNQETRFQEEFDASGEMLDAFWSFAEKEDFLTITATADSVNRAERVYPQSERAEARAFVANRLKGNLAGQLFGLDTRQAILNETSPFFQRAMELWPASERLAAYHGYSVPAGEAKTGR